MALRYRYAQGRRQLTASGRDAVTNDLGEYRIFGLSPGQYVLAAVQAAGSTTMSALSDNRHGYAPTYYPGTPDVEQAQRVTIGIGQELGNIDMPLMPARMARVSGTASDAHGRPLAGALVLVRRRGGPAIMSTGGTRVQPDGSFTLSNVAPGEYLLQATSPGSGMDRAEMPTAHVTVAGQDVTGVQLTAAKPAIGRGRVVLDSEFRTLVPAASVRLIATPARPDDEVLPSLGEGRVDDDYTFELKTRPGLTLLRVAAPTGWSLRAVRHNGSDVTDTGVAFRPDETTDGIEVELTNRLTEVSGTVSNSRREPVTDYTVVVFSQNRERWGYLSRFLQAVRPDQNGRYRVQALPAGEYYAIALESVEPGEATDPDFLDRVRGRAASFALGEGETKTLHLELSPAR